MRLTNGGGLHLQIPRPGFRAMISSLCLSDKLSSKLVQVTTFWQMNLFPCGILYSILSGQLRLTQYVLYFQVSSDLILRDLERIPATQRTTRHSISLCTILSILSDWICIRSSTAQPDRLRLPRF